MKVQKPKSNAGHLEWQIFATKLSIPNVNLQLHYCHPFASEITKNAIISSTKELNTTKFGLISILYIVSVILDFNQSAT